MIYVGQYENDYLKKDLYTIDELLEIIQELGYERDEARKKLKDSKEETNEDFEFDSYRENLLGEAYGS